MPDLLGPALQEFNEDLRRMRQLVSLVKSLREFGAADVPEGVGEDPFIVRATELRSLVRSLGVDLPVLSGTLVLFLAGRFEHFVRMSFESHCDSLALKCSSFAQLPTKMQASLRYHTAEVAIAPSKYGFDDVEVLGFIVALAGNISSADGLGSVNSACLSITQNNLAPQILADLYKRIGVVNLWQDLAKQARMKTFLELEKDTDSEREARSRLEELMTTRNQIAHPSGSPAFPGPEKVAGHIEYLDVLAATLTDLSRVHIAAFKPGVAGTDPTES